MTRDSDIVTRYAGDEFVVVLPGISTQETLAFIRRLQNQFQNNPLKAQGASIPVSMSSGIASVGDDGVGGPASLLRNADKMLYNIKELKSTARSSPGNS